jgi:hypothetical protein
MVRDMGIEIGLGSELVAAHTAMIGGSGFLACHITGKLKGGEGGEVDCSCENSRWRSVSNNLYVKEGATWARASRSRLRLEASRAPQSHIRESEVPHRSDIMSHCNLTD